MTHDVSLDIPAGDEFFRRLLEDTPDYAIFVTDDNGQILKWNRGAESIFGWKQAEVIGRHASLIFPPEEQAQGAPGQEPAQAANGGKAPDARWHVRKDGTHFWARGGMSALRDDGGQIRAYGKILIDATADRQIEEALAISEERLRLAIAGADVGTWHWDLLADTLLFSERSMAIFGLPLDGNVTYETFLSILHPEDRELVDQAVVRALHSRTDYDFEYRIIRPNAGIRWINAKGRGYYDPEGRAVRFEGIVQDVTDRRRTNEELSARAERESLLNRIGQVLRASLDPDIVQARAMSVLGLELGADRCYYSVFDEALDHAWIGADWRRAGLPSLAGEYHFSDFRITLDEIYGNERTLVVEDKQALFPEPASALRDFPVRSLIGVPFFDGGRCVAALTVAMAEEPRAWTPGEVAVVELAATQIRAAIETARMFQREQNIALSLQETLQPALPRHVAGMDLAFFYKSALKESNVGGDFADVFTLDHGGTALVVGDLSGKGLAAATQVATVRNMLRSVIYLQPTLAEAITRLNGVVTRQGLLTGFVTLFVACYDADARTLRYVSCGHEPGLVRRAATGRVEELLPTGPIFGAAEEVSYEEVTVTLHPGDTLLLYTDGLTEAGPSRRDFLGVPGMIRLLEAAGSWDAASIVAETISGVQAFARGILRDDACLLAGVVQ